MFERKVLPPALVLALLVPGASFAGSILRFFQDGCAATGRVQVCEGGARAGAPCTPDPILSPLSRDCCLDPVACSLDDPNQTCTSTSQRSVQVCEGGARAGAPCTQDPSFPPFSRDCCRDLLTCFFDDPNNTCSDPSPPRTCVSGTLGRSCVTNAGCDSFLCLAGDPNTLGESCTLDVDCGDPDNFLEVDCGSAVDGACGEPAAPDTSSSVLGNVLQVNDDTYLLAVVTGVIQTAQPSYNKKDRRQVQFGFQLIDKEDLLFTDPEFCELAVQLGEPLTPTQGILENGTSP